MSDNANQSTSQPAIDPAVAGLVGVVKAAGGNLSEAARRLGIPRDTVVSRLRRHGLLPLAREARQKRQRDEERALRTALEEVSPSDRVRLLLVPERAREVLLAELATRDDLDEAARALLRAARQGSSMEAA